MEIRKAEESDIEKLIEFGIGVALESENRVLKPEVIRNGVLELFKYPQKGTFYIAIVEGVSAGSLFVTKQWVDWENKYIYYIQSVYTHPEYRGRGVFKSLFNYVKDEAEKNALSLKLYADYENNRAIEVYHRLGMTIANERFLEISLIP